MLNTPQKSSCSRFNAIEMQNKLKFKGCVVTGVIGVTCGRHFVFQSMADLHKGERYVKSSVDPSFLVNESNVRFTNTDFAIARALKQVMMSAVMAKSMHTAKQFRRVIITYDVACQFSIKFKTRFGRSFPDFEFIVDLIYFLVAKMHLFGHIDGCKYKYNLNYFFGSGRIHGEGIETTWAESKQAGGSTRQMNAGHRHDKVNDLHNFWNWMKLVGLRELDLLHRCYCRTDDILDSRVLDEASNCSSNQVGEKGTNLRRRFASGWARIR